LFLLTLTDLVSWRSLLQCSVVQTSLVSAPFRVNSGVRQGGVLSPFLFAVYVDDFIVELRQSGLGLNIGSTFTGALLNADDIALLACSCLGLQKLINICMAFGLQWDIRFNPVKSQIVSFGSKSPVWLLLSLW